MRNAFAEQIYDTANINDNVVLLSGNHLTFFPFIAIIANQK